MKVVIIAAVSDDGVIGRRGKVPWRIPQDMERFRRVTTGHCVIMGRKTFESLGKPLAGRRNIVVTRNRSFSAEGVVVAHDVGKALDYCRARGEDQVFVIGGGEIYQQTIGLADVLLLTCVHESVEGDTRFPPFEKADWEEVSREDHGGYSFVELRRRRSRN